MGFFQASRNAGYIDELVQFIDSSGASDVAYFACRHHNYNLTALLDTGGAVAERYDYDPYGKRYVLDVDYSADADGQSDLANPIGHQGLYHDHETGLIYNRARMLSPTLRRFIQRDPLGYVDGANVYPYYAGMWGGVDPWGMRARNCTKERNDCYRKYGYGAAKCEYGLADCQTGKKPGYHENMYDPPQEKGAFEEFIDLKNEGIETVFSLVNSGSFLAEDEVADAMTEAFLRQANVQVQCWKCCMVEANKMGVAALGAALGLSPHISSPKVVTKPFLTPAQYQVYRATGGWGQNVSHTAVVAAGKGKRGLAQRLVAKRDAWLNRAFPRSGPAGKRVFSPTGAARAAAKPAAKGILTAELLASIYCSTKCMF